MMILDSGGTVIAESGVSNTYGYTGRRWDNETGLWYYRNRMYSPTLGRFMQRDPAGYVDGVNLYAYVKNNPIKYIDPLGLTAELAAQQEAWDYWGWKSDFVLQDKSTEDMTNEMGSRDEQAEYIPYIRLPIPGSVEVSREIPHVKMTIPNYGSQSIIHQSTYSPSFAEKTWVGVSIEASGELFVGRHGETGTLVNLEDPSKIAGFRRYGWKLGVGGGGSEVANFIIVTNVHDLKEIETQSISFDWDLALLKQFGTAVKGIKGLKNIYDLLQDHHKLRYVIETTLKNRNNLSHDPQAIKIPIPSTGYGINLWIGYKTDNLEVFLSD